MKSWITRRMIGLMAAGLCMLSSSVAQAQQYSSVTITGTVNVAANVTNTSVSNVITLTDYDEICLQSRAYLDGAGTSGIIYTFDASSDGTSYDPAYFTWTVLATGASTNVVVTNVTVGAVGYLKLAGIGNGNGETNHLISLKYNEKPRRREFR